MAWVGEEMRVEGRKEETISQDGLRVIFRNGCGGVLEQLCRGVEWTDGPRSR